VWTEVWACDGLPSPAARADNQGQGRAKGGSGLACLSRQSCPPCHIFITSNAGTWLPVL
jgi:hypothetical protein